MRPFPKPIVVASKCLGSGICRYDGERLDDLFARRLRRHVKLIPVCPEMEIDLGVPRDRIDVVRVGGTKTLYQLATGRNLTRRMNSFSRRFLNSLGEVDGFLLKSKSPSCGIRDARVLASPDPKARVIGRDSGFFAGEVLERFGRLAIEDERRLEDPRIRHHWLTKLFTLAAFREVWKFTSGRRLAEFHTQNNFRLTAYSRKQKRILDRIVTDSSHRPANKVIAEYEKHLHLALRGPARSTSNIKILLGALYHFSEHLSPSETRSFLDLLKRHREGRIPLIRILKTVGIWAVRYDKTYVRDQSFFRPYPGELMEMQL